jgi:hypothetical protein
LSSCDPGLRSFQHLEIAIGIADGDYRAASNVLVDANRFAFLMEIRACSPPALLPPPPISFR